MLPETVRFLTFIDSAVTSPTSAFEAPSEVVVTETACKSLSEATPMGLMKYSSVVPKNTVPKKRPVLKTAFSNALIVLAKTVSTSKGNLETSLTDPVRYSSTSLTSTMGISICWIPRALPGKIRSTYWFQNPLKMRLMRAWVKSEKPSERISKAPNTKTSVSVWLVTLDHKGTRFGRGS